MTLRQARPGDESRLLALLAGQPYFNLFALSNLREGLSADREAWVHDGAGVLIRRGASWTLGCGPEPDQLDVAAAAEVVDAFPTSLVRVLTGVPSAAEPVVTHLRRHRGQISHESFAVLFGEPTAVPYVGSPRPARPSDVDGLSAIYADAGDMSRPREAVEQMIPRTWVVEDRVVVTAAAAVSAETDQAAMIGAVFTPVEHRRKGYATTLLHALSGALHASGKRPCLFYDNPEARRVYLRLGYQELGPWLLVRFV